MVVCITTERIPAIALPVNSLALGFLYLWEISMDIAVKIHCDIYLLGLCVSVSEGKTMGPVASQVRTDVEGPLILSQLHIVTWKDSFLSVRVYTFPPTISVILTASWPPRELDHFTFADAQFI